MLGTECIIAPKIPRGLTPAVEGLAREILRERPRDVYTFAAHHFEKLVELRDKEYVSKAVNVPSSKKRDRFSEWTKVNNNLAEGSEYYSSHRSIGRYDVSARDATKVRKERIATVILRKLAKEEREATTGNELSVDESCKVKQKQSDPGEGKVRNIRKHDNPIGRNLSSYSQEECSPRSLRLTIRGRLVRSSSVGNIVLVDKGRRYHPREEEERYSRLSSTKRHELARNADNARESSDADISGIIARTRSRSLASDAGFWKGESVDHDKLESGIQQNRKCRDQRGSLAETLELEESKSTEEIPGSGELVARSRLQTRRESEEEWGETSQCDDKNDVALPSVVTKQSSDKWTRNGVPKSIQKQGSSDNLALPPITSEPVRCNKEEDDLELPAVIIKPEESLNQRESTDSSWYREKASEREVEKELDSRRSTEEENVEEKSEQLHEIEEVLSVLAKPIEVELENREVEEADEIDESFKDSLNVTPDLTEASQRLDSLEADPEGQNESGIVEERPETSERMEKSECGSSELRRKLIEIEMVERNIESTLVSSDTISINNHAPEETLGSEETLLVMESEEQESMDETEQRKLNKDDSIRAKEDNSAEENAATLVTESRVAPRNSPDNSNISACETDTARSSSCEVKPRKEDFSRYVLTEGSPCEIPDTVTTVVIREEEDPPREDVLDHDQKADDSIRFTKKPSSPETRQRGKEFQELDRQDTAFGEYVQPEELDSSPFVNGGILQSMKSTIDRSSTRKDLENIKEEEENESVDLSNEIVQGRSVSSTGESESAKENDNNIDREIVLKSIGDEEQIAPVEQTPEETSERDYNDVLGKEDPSQEEEKVSTNNHSGDPSLLDATPHVPELNLDSLQDTTISSLDESDSKALEHPSENGIVSSCDCESKSSHSIDALPSGRNLMLLPSEEESLPEGLVDNSENVESNIEHDSGEVHAEQDVQKLGGSEDSSRSLEEEIARELIENLILDSPMLMESQNQERVENNDLKNQKVEENGGETEEKHSGKIVEEKEKDGKGKGEEADSTKVSKELTKETSKEDSEELNDREKHEELGDIPRVKETSKMFSARHTGEFHDCIPLSIVEIPRSGSLFSSEDQSLKPSNLAFGTNDNKEQTIVSNMIFPNSVPYAAIVPPMIDLSKISFIFPQAFTRSDEALNKVPSTKTTAASESTVDDLREPLALDSTPKPVIIEEISNVDENERKEASLRSSGSSSTRETSRPSADDNSVQNSVEEERIKEEDGSKE